jgi:ribose 5-phosphate isomerase A
MVDYKLEAAKAALPLIKPGQVIGLGAGTTIANLLKLISGDNVLSPVLIFTSSSFKTTNLLLECGLNVQSPAFLNHIDIYFDGCDQFDKDLNALKSGGGIHTTEKILASMATEFILLGDESKFAETLGTTYPLVIEILPAALQVVFAKLKTDFPGAEIKLRFSDKKDGAAITENGNMLADIHFSTPIAPERLNIRIKMIPGIVDHSLFYRMATKAIIAGKDGIRVILPQY